MKDESGKMKVKVFLPFSSRVAPVCAPSWIFMATIWFMAVALSGCASTPVLPQVDLSAAGWQVYTGQALWKADADRPPLAGELIVARHANGDRLISFSKPPIPMFTAQTVARAWRIDFIERGRTYGGHGDPPGRFIWFLLPDLLEGAAAPKGWTMSVQDEVRWSLVNPKKGEEILFVVDR
jgi:hypothetical protein